MARKPRIEFYGAFYHVITRGNQRQKIFKGLEDYKRYLQYLSHYKDRYPYLLYAYVLMANHVHLLIETQTTPLSKILQGINQRYTIYFNRKYKTVGHLFQGRYKAILCERDSYLLGLVKYIHRNPIRAGVAKTLGAYPWSSHHAYVGVIDSYRLDSYRLVDTEQVLGIFSARKGVARKRYQEFMEGEGEFRGEEVYATVDQRLQGSEEFIGRILEEHTGGGLSRGIRRRAYSLLQISKAVETIFGLKIEDLRSTGKTRKVLLGRRLFSLAAKEYGYKGREIAEYLEKDPAVVTAYTKGREELEKEVKELTNHLEK
jgi:putative transposase